MKYTEEKDLFNKNFPNPVFYIFSPSRVSNQFILTEYVSNNPFRVRSIDSSNDVNVILNKGKSIASQNKTIFIDNEIFVPI